LHENKHDNVHKSEAGVGTNLSDLENISTPKMMLKNFKGDSNRTSHDS